MYTLENAVDEIASTIY